jgi:hypothetical protein
VAVGVGSRCIANPVEILQEVVDNLKKSGAKPFKNTPELGKIMISRGCLADLADKAHVSVDSSGNLKAMI